MSAASTSTPEVETPFDRLHSGAEDSEASCADCLPADIGLRDVFDAISGPMLLVDSEGRIVLANKAGRCLLSARRPPMTVSDLPEPWEVLSAMLRLAQNGLCPVQQEISDPALSRTWVASVRRLLLGCRREARFLVEMMDVSETVKLQRSLEAAEALAHTGSVLAGAAHQAKNVLFGITATLDALQRQHHARLAGDPLMENLHEAVKRMQLVIRDLFDLGRTSDRERVRFSTECLVTEAIAACRPLALERGVQMEARVSQGICMYGSPAPLARALENIIDNAVRHSPSGGAVQIEQCLQPERPEWLRCTVHDNGPGFPAENMHRLGDPFLSLRPGGTGLGLAVARRVIREHGGTLSLGNGEAGGALVTILLPLDRRAAGSQQLSRASELN